MEGSTMSWSALAATAAAASITTISHRLLQRGPLGLSMLAIAYPFCVNCLAAW
jgi:hypothetical protein